MTDEEKVTNGRNSRGSHQLRNNDLTTVIKTAEEKLQDTTGNLNQSPSIDPSIYQTDVVTGDQTATTTVAPAPGAESAAEASAEGAAAEAAPSAESDQASAEDAQPAPDQPAPEGEPAAAAESVEKVESAETSAEPEAKSDLAEGQEPAEEKPADESATPTSETQQKSDDETSEGGTKAASPDGTTRRTSTTDVTTTQTPSKEPYQIDIPIQRKINKRTQRKLWEEIEKRKPLIPKYVERHIQKYAKPPFELWGCKFRGKGSCYGCGG